MTGYFERYTSAAPLAIFRMMLGGLLFISIVRFWLNGWIESIYILPKHHFTFYGFEFVKPLGPYTYILFAICAVAALLVALGLFYRLGITLLFLSFTYIELIDKSTYLNHYYFISLVAFIMIWLPANRDYSLDTWLKPNSKRELVPAWTIGKVRVASVMKSTS